MSSTYRERRLAKAERLREWAGKREAKADAAYKQAETMASAIPLGQPILTDHYSAGRDIRYRERMRNTATRGYEHQRKAEEMASRAANIEAAAERAIYNDDPDAVDRLRERIAGLEAERDMLKRYNASCRKAAKTGGTGDLSILNDKWRAEIATLARVCPYQVRAGGAFPAYASSNLSGNIGRLRKRLEALEGKQS